LSLCFVSMRLTFEVFERSPPSDSGEFLVVLRLAIPQHLLKQIGRLSQNPRPFLRVFCSPGLCAQDNPATFPVFHRYSPTVNLSPTGTKLIVGLSQQYSAKVNTTGSTAVLWTVSGKGCTGKDYGVISADGLYTAPLSVPVFYHNPGN
jgi:hypothetical protein